jgi:hypothetical protein
MKKISKRDKIMIFVIYPFVCICIGLDVYWFYSNIKETAIACEKAALQPNGSYTICNYSGKNLSNLDLSGSDFTKANLSNVDFSNSNLENANFSEAVMENAIFTNSNLSGAIFKYANVKGADFTGAVLKEITIDSSNLFESHGINYDKLPEWLGIPNDELMDYMKEKSINPQSRESMVNSLMDVCNGKTVNVVSPYDGDNDFHPTFIFSRNLADSANYRDPFSLVKNENNKIEQFWYSSMFDYYDPDDTAFSINRSIGYYTKGFREEWEPYASVFTELVVCMDWTDTVRERCEYEHNGIVENINNVINVRLLSPEDNKEIFSSTLEGITYCPMIISYKNGNRLTADYVYGVTSDEVRRIISQYTNPPPI